ncbi:glycoside hydrolase family 25 protein [Nonomuraea jiangxiensis]|uniref:Lysozyme n=1 Tax=Nonomuraea jiangxiensis TaxID=633440 RepID=A0A1G8DGG5_9ACTN|nr:GH25 family lysozyme [Nonomuraea jiangxiensis]SDH56798.1 lysozyme [Nonomuraea jiangxiensis]
MLKPRLTAIAHILKDHLNPYTKRLTFATGAALVAGIVAAASVTGTAIARSADFGVGQEAGSYTYGLDVSHYEPLYNWAASPAQFGIIKATEGVDFRDASFARHWQELGKKGIVRGAYHYGHPAGDPIAEANYFLSTVNAQPAKPGDLLVLDLETTDGKSVPEVNAWAKTWLSYVKAKTGVAPMFYSSWRFANIYGHGLSDYPLWVAHYGKEKGTVTPPADWKTWTIHQYSESPIDQNVSTLTPDQLRDLGRPAV